MKSSNKVFAAIAAAGIMGVSAFAQAQQGPCGMGNCGGPMMGQMGMGGMAGGRFDPAVRAEQRLTRLHRDLKVTPEQEPLWKAFEEKAKAEAGKGREAMRATAQDLSLTAPERMTRMTEIMKQRVAAMESVNESFKRLYDALTPEQKRVADVHAARMGHMHNRRGMMGGMSGMGGMGGMGGMWGMGGMGGMGPRGGMPPVPPVPAAGN